MAFRTIERILCFECAKKTEEASRPRLNHGELTRARDNATHEKSDIASTSLWQEIFTHTCVIRLLYNLWKKRWSTRSVCRTCNLGQNKMEQQPSHPHRSEIKDEAPLWLVGRGDFPFILSTTLVTCVPSYAPKITYCKTKLRDTELCKLPFAIHISLFRLPILFTGSQQVNKIIDTNHHCSISR